MTFLGVRFYIDVYVSLVDKRFKGFRRRDWKWAWHRVMLRSASCRLTFACSLFIPYCNVFRRLCLEHYLKTLTQWGKASHFSHSHSRIEHRLLNPPVNRWIEALNHLRHYLRFLVESWPAWTKLRTRLTILSFPPRPLLASCLRHVCHLIEQGSCPRMPLFTEFSCFLRLTSLGTSFWLKISLHISLRN